ncbi:uncharacterized protein DSM5745_07987 [Aspergillus mulundensis]|uniref:Calcium channel YVC1-like C-terminal transmembrane domain-containing protein n=1 Tax=Aspergillus mulundensis TaxID=1810919 RepID=A0A3D8R914_9EURO|nr:hypothetical protein DSM5745_07987 [Aspergillus mulundensis]RDW70476.1 hypothetical protein DSM5745_07987 [Aspergillus mulundensis]
MLHASVASLAPSTNNDHFDVPIIDDDEPLVDVVQKLHSFMTSSISEVWYKFEEIKLTPDPRLRALVNSLAEDSHNPRIIAALMILKWKFGKAAEHDDGQNDTRGYACEYVAWQFSCHLNQRELIEFLLEELRPQTHHSNSLDRAEAGVPSFAAFMAEGNSPNDENTPLLSASTSRSQAFEINKRHGGFFGSGHPEFDSYFSDADGDELSIFLGLNALEIATIAHAKKFLSQMVVQKVVNDIWNGEIVFWNSLSVHSTKKPQRFNKRTADPYSRLRVPVYRKAFEALFFVSFLFLYYAVLIERNPRRVGNFEAVLYVWIAAFAYDELSSLVDSGMLFYQMTFWNLWDLCIIGTGLAFVVTRIIGLGEKDGYITDLSFDILSLEALFLVPRIFSLVSLNQYFGSLIPVLKEMTKAFLRFIPVIIILYLGFLTTFTMLARDRLSTKRMSWILVYVFFGSNYLGFDICYDVSAAVSKPSAFGYLPGLWMWVDVSSPKNADAAPQDAPNEPPSHRVFVTFLVFHAVYDLNLSFLIHIFGAEAMAEQF